MIPTVLLQLYSIAGARLKELLDADRPSILDTATPSGGVTSNSRSGRGVVVIDIERCDPVARHTVFPCRIKGERVTREGTATKTLRRPVHARVLDTDVPRPVSERFMRVRRIRPSGIHR